MLSFKLPCILAANSSLGTLAVLLPPPLVVPSARSHSEFSESIRDGLELDQGWQGNMCIGYADPGFMDPLNALSGQYTDWNILRNYSLSIPPHVCIKALLSKRIVAEGVHVGWVHKPARGAAIRSVRGNCKRQHWDSILLCETNRS